MKEFAEGIQAISDGFAALISSLTPLLWTAVIVFLIYYHRDALKNLILSLAGREFSLEVGGQKLSFKEYDSQQAQRIAALETRVMQLEGRQAAPQDAEAAEQSPEGEDAETPCKKGPLEAFKVSTLRNLLGKTQAAITSLLWVDDNPKNNAVLIGGMQVFGVQVETALTTAAAMERFTKGGIAMVISDMGRIENGVYHPRAGLELAEQIRALDENIPIALYSTSQVAHTAQADLERLHLSHADSSYELLRCVHTELRA
ncbi:hypothetical protein [Megalodesulfovibrio paquesii]